MMTSSTSTPTRSDELDAAIDIADPVALLLSLVQITGDVELLNRFGSGIEVAATRGVQFRPAVSDALAGQIRDHAKAVLPAGSSPVIDVPELPLFKRMVSCLAGEEVPDEFLPLLLEQAGFVFDQRVLPADAEPPADFTVAIIGGGMVGLVTAIKLQRAGFRFRIYESGNDFGGTWNNARYPGVAVDTPSHYYSLSFELNPDWSRYYPSGDEYRQYLQGVARKYGLYEHAEFNVTVQDLTWDDEAQRWLLTGIREDGERVADSANVVVPALGFLNSAKWPSMPSLTDYAGVIVHAAEWRDDVELSGKRVILVGTGATAAQLVPEIAPDVAGLTVIQRSPHWMLPSAKGDQLVPDAEKYALASIPFYHHWYRLGVYWFTSDKMRGAATYDPEWAAGHEISVSQDNDYLLQLCLNHLDRMFGDRPDLKSKLMPDYPPFGKRPVQDVGFFETLKRPNVSLVTGEVRDFTETGLTLRDGTRLEADIVILATGYTLDFLSTIKINGRQGADLQDAWRERGPHALLGSFVPGFPNLMMTSGPNCGNGYGGGHNLQAEEQSHFILECLQWMVNENATSLEVTAEANELYNDHLEAEMEKMVWRHTRGANNFYIASNGRVLTPVPWRMVDFWTMLRKPDPAHFVLRKASGDRAGQWFEDRRSPRLTHAAARGSRWRAPRLRQGAPARSAIVHSENTAAADRSQVPETRPHA